MQIEARVALRQTRAMDRYKELAVAYLRSVIDQTGRSASELAKAIDLAPSTFTRPINSKTFKYAPKFQALKAVSDLTGVPLPPALLAANAGLTTKLPNRVSPAFLPVRYRVQAGHWFEVDSYADGFIEDARYPVSPDPSYSQAGQWLELVVGDSVDLEIPDGHYAHVVDAADMGYSPRDGDLVVIERRRAGGLIRERTIKQVSVTDGRVTFIPRSRNPRWNEPLSMTDGAANDDAVEVQLVGLVVGSYRPMRTPR